MAIGLGKLLGGLLGGGDATRAAPSEELATALLLLELARSDFDLADTEQTRIRQLLARRYALDEAALEALMRDAQTSAAKSVSLHEYVQTLNGALDGDGKRELMTMLWQVAYADGRIDKYEEHLLRRLTDLLHVPMPDYIQIKLDAAAQNS